MAQRTIDDKLRRRFHEWIRTQSTFPKDARAFVDLPEAAPLFRLRNIAWANRALEAELHPPESVTEPDSFQMILPGFSGLGERLPVKGGRKMTLREMTPSSLEQHLALQRKKALSSPQILRVERLLREMEPYIRDHPRLTVGKYYELRAAGAPTPARVAKGAAS